MMINDFLFIEDFNDDKDDIIIIFEVEMMIS